MEVRKEVSSGEAVSFSAKSADLDLLLNNQNSLSISPELTRQGSFVVIISKEKIEGTGGELGYIHRLRHGFMSFLFFLKDGASFCYYAFVLRISGLLDIRVS